MAYFVAGERYPTVEELRQGTSSLTGAATVVFGADGKFYWRIDNPQVGEQFGFLSDVSIADFGNHSIIQDVTLIGSMTLYQVAMVHGQPRLVTVSNGTPQTDEVLGARFPTFSNNSHFEKLVVTPGYSGDTYLPEFYLEASGATGIFDEFYGPYGFDAPNDGRALIVRGTISGQRDTAWGNWVDVVSSEGNSSGQPPYDVPEGVKWLADEARPGSYESPIYTIDPDTGAWTIKGFTDAVRDTIPVEDLKFYSGQGKEALFDGASAELTNIAMDFVEKSIPASLFRMITAVQEAKSVKGLMKEFFLDTFAELERGADALFRGGTWDDGALASRSQDFQRDLNSNVLGRYGESASGIYDAIGRARVVIEHSDLKFVAEDSDVRQIFAAPAGHHVAVIAAMGGDDITGGNLSDLLVGRGGRDALKGAGGNDRLYGGPGADLLIGGSGTDLMEGGSGNDIYDVDNVGDRVYETTKFGGTINAGGTDTVRSSVTYALGNFVENLTLTGATAINGTGNSLHNVLNGNSAKNILNGGSGNDRLNGGAGADTMVGGAGSDTYYVDNVGDVVTETIASAASGGTDIVFSALAAYTLRANVENGRVNTTGSANLTGNGLNNVIYAGAGNNVLDGGSGTDTVSYAYGLVSGATKGVSVDLRIATAQATGGSKSDTIKSFENITGSSLVDKLTGTADANVINGGTGADTMIGGAGNDTYYVDNIGDKVYETTTISSTVNAGGTDTVRSSVNYKLGNFVDKLTLTGTAAINGTGNTLANSLTGNAAANVLNGGIGADTMLGGAGNDTYYIDNIGDKVFETTTTSSAVNAGGTDTVNSAISFSLTASIGVSFVERLTLTGTATINGTGNSLHNVLTGNSAKNTLSGGSGNDVLNGGAGYDVLLGGAGNDTYYVDSAGDKVYETTTTTSATNAGGTDKINSSVTFNLASYTGVSFVENLTLTGTAAINGTGNALANTLSATAWPMC